MDNPKKYEKSSFKDIIEDMDDVKNKALESAPGSKSMDIDPACGRVPYT